MRVLWKGGNATRLGKPAARLAGNGRMIQITAQMRVLVAIEAVDGRKGIDALARLCQEKLAAPRPGPGGQPRGVDAVELRRDDCARWNMMNADWPERPGIRVKDRKQITPDERAPLELSDRERELILKHTFADDELTGRSRIVRRPGEPPVYRFTLDDLDELAGYVAEEANHAKDKKLEKQLHWLYRNVETEKVPHSRGANPKRSCRRPMGLKSRPWADLTTLKTNCVSPFRLSASRPRWCRRSERGKL
jgi:hypothetical protein